MARSKTVTADVAKDLSLPVHRGLVVTAVEAGSPAAKLEIQAKDIVFQLGQFFLADFDQLGTVLEEAKAGQSPADRNHAEEHAGVGAITARDQAASKPATTKTDGKVQI